MEITSQLQLKLALEERISKSMKDLEGYIYKSVKEFLDKFYGEFSPVMYIRTEQFLHSLIATDIVYTGKGFEFMVYIDYSKVNYRIKRVRVNGVIYTMENKGLSDEEIMNRNLQGYHGRVKGTSICEKALCKLIPNIVSKLKSYMRANGIPVKWDMSVVAKTTLFL